MRRFFFTVLFLLCSASSPALAWVDAVFSCQPDNFVLRRDGNGFALYGAIETAFPGYGYEISPVTGNGDGNGEATLTLVAPSGNVVPRPSRLALGQPFMSIAWPVSHLVIHIHGGARYVGPVEIECFQRGGSQ